MIAARLMKSTRTRFFSIHVPKSPAVCRFESTSTVRWGSVNGTSSKAETKLDKRTPGRWNRVLFTDESRFNVQFVDGRLRVWRRTGECMDENNIVQRDRYGGGSVMILGGMLVCNSGKTELVTVDGRLSARRYCDEIIIPVVISVLQRGTAEILQQNNARCHVVRHTMFVQPFYSRATFRHSTGLYM